MQIQYGYCIAVVAMILTEFVLARLGVNQVLLSRLGTLFLLGLLARRFVPTLIRMRLMRLRSSDSDIQFHPELFELRNSVLELLAKHDIVWLSDFGAVDLRHDMYGFEVTGIQTEKLSIEIERRLRGLCPWWWWRHRYFEDTHDRELGWKVIFSKLADYTREEWKSARDDSEDR